MSKRPRKRAKRKSNKAPPATNPIGMPSAPALDHERARELIIQGEFGEATSILDALLSNSAEKSERALIVNDLATIQAFLGNHEAARTGFREALALDESCESATTNLFTLDSASVPTDRHLGAHESERHAVSPGMHAIDPDAKTTVSSVPERPPAEIHPGGIKIAIVSFLFNWPSTGGGIVHTVELAQFLSKAGYNVRHFFARYLEWGIGLVSGTLSFASEPIDFDKGTWRASLIQEQFRSAVDEFEPDYVIITDSWNFKPLLAEAMHGYPYLLRLQAMECICPLTNVRLLMDAGGKSRQCQREQLGEPDACNRCLSERGTQSGRLHQMERALSAVGTPEYHERLIRAFREAEVVLVVNPLTAAIIAPYCKQVQVVTAGMDSRRFPTKSKSIPPVLGAPSHGRRPIQLFFAGIVEEYMKGFHVLHQACSILRSRRNDFELIATGDPPGQRDHFTRFIGWLSQDELAAHLQTIDVLVMPTIAQEALGRTAVEAMAAGRPVVASRIGGLPFTVREGVTGLLCKPDDPVDLAAAIEFLLDNPVAREQMGLQGRQRFEQEYAWETIIERHYVPLLSRRRTSESSNGECNSTPDVAEESNASSTVAHRSGARGGAEPATGGVHLSLIVSVLESYEVVRRQLLRMNGILTDDCELIVVDDGSSPSLEETCDSIAKNYSFRLLMTHDRREWTQPRARNLGAAAARGRKLLFFDIDHVITSSIIEAALNFDGDKLHWVRRPGILDEHGGIVTDEAVLKGHGMRDSSPSIHINSFVIRRELFETLGGFDERFCGSYGGDDVDFNARYNRLCELGRARPDDVAGEGYVYPDPAFNGGRMFHRLARIVANSDQAATKANTLEARPE